ncbi:MAG: head-tail connector protein [Beijerinckiaceae bacterium]
MTPFLLEGPVVEPVSLADMKDWLRITTADEDGVISKLISAARLTVEAASGQILVSQKWRLVLDSWPANGIVRVPLRPLISCDAIRVFTGLSTSETIAATAYELDVRSDPPRIALTHVLPVPARALAGIEIDVTAGTGTAAAMVPADLVQAVKRLTAHWFEKRGDEPNMEPPLPPDVVARIAPYRRVRIS